MSQPLRVTFQTLGCRLNQYETDSLASRFREAGYLVVPEDQAADIRIINTCTVTDRADRKSRHAAASALRSRSDLPVGGHNPFVVTDLRSSPLTPPVTAATTLTAAASLPPASAPALAPQDQPDPPKARLVVVTGCATGTSKPWTASPRLLVVPNHAKSGLFDQVDALVRGETDQSPLAAPRSPGATHGTNFDYPSAGPGFHTRGTIKIQDGCDNFCTFCIIPHVRGRATSRSPDQVLANAVDLIARGVRELVLTGVNMARYHHGAVDFTGLIRAVLDLPGDFRVRIASLEPDGLGQDFVALFAHPRLCPSLHLCLQSGSQRILFAMRRQYTVDEYAALVTSLMEVRPDIAISTDLIAGFPGEEDTDHQASLTLTSRLGLSGIHAFTYSRREGTRAERMEAQVPPGTKKTRHQALVTLGEALDLAYRRRLVGTPSILVVETTTVDKGIIIARGRLDQGIDVSVELGPAPPAYEPERASAPGRWWNRALPVSLVEPCRAVLQEDAATARDN